MKLNFSRGNAKLDALEEKFGKQVWSFSLLSGHSCPYAKDCESSAIQKGGGLAIQDGPHTKFRCFSASQEVLFTNVYNSRKHNHQILEMAAKSPEKAADILIDNLPKKAGIVRIHVAGDFTTKAYFKTWLLVAQKKPDILFYAYTKSLPFWIAHKNEIPPNFILTASYGGHKDDLIDKHNLRYVKVVYSKAEARKLKLPIDHDDSHAADPKKAGHNFALLIHGIQPPDSEAGRAVYKLKGEGSYVRK